MGTAEGAPLRDPTSIAAKATNAIENEPLHELAQNSASILRTATDTRKAPRAEKKISLTVMPKKNLAVMLTLAFTAKLLEASSGKSDTEMLRPATTLAMRALSMRHQELNVHKVASCLAPVM